LDLERLLSKKNERIRTPEEKGRQDKNGLENRAAERERRRFAPTAPPFIRGGVRLGRVKGKRRGTAMFGKKRLNAAYFVKKAERGEPRLFREKKTTLIIR